MFAEAPVSVTTIQGTVSASWGMDPNHVEYAPIGYGSYHWCAWEPDGTQWLVTLDRVDARPIREAYRAAQVLAADLPFVRGPSPNAQGESIVVLDGWWVSLWRWIEGRVGDHSTQRSEPDLTAVLSCLRILHDYRGLPRTAALVEDWAIPGRRRLAEIAEASFVPGEPGPFTQEVLERLRANYSHLRDQFALYDQLAARVTASAEYVVTHGEPHPGNVIHTPAGVSIIDWDTLRWAPRERDLWAIGDPAEWRAHYGHDVALSPDALEVYRLQWTLVEIAEFVPGLIGARQTTPDLDVAITEVRKYLPL